MKDHFYSIEDAIFINDTQNNYFWFLRSQLKVKVALSCLTLCDSIGYIVHGILQARILERVAFPFSRESSQPRDWTQVSCIAGGFSTRWATREAQEYWSGYPIPSPADLLDPGVEPGSPVLQMDSLPTELSGKPLVRRGPNLFLGGGRICFNWCTFDL